MILLEKIKQHFQDSVPWSRVLDHGTEDDTQVVVVGDLKEVPILIFTAVPQQLVVERISAKGDFEQVFALEGNWSDIGVLVFVSLKDWSGTFPSFRFPVKEFERIGLGEETCEWEWMRDQKSKVFTHRIVLSKEESMKHSDKLDRQGFKRMFERVLGEFWRGNKKLRSEVEHEWHRCWVTEGED